MFEMLSGTLPFNGDNPLALALTQVQTPPPPFPNSSQVPQSIQKLVYRLLQKSPDDRPQSAAQVAKELMELELALGTAATSNAPSAGQSQTPARSARWAWWLLALLFLGLAAGGVEWFWYSNTNQTPEAPAEVHPVEIAPPLPTPPPIPNPAHPRRRPAEGPVRLYLPPGYSPAVHQQTAPATPQPHAATGP